MSSRNDDRGSDPKEKRNEIKPESQPQPIKESGSQKVKRTRIVREEGSRGRKITIIEE